MKTIIYLWLCMLCILSTVTGQNPVWTLPQKYTNGFDLFNLPTNSPSGGYDGSPSTAFHAAWPDEERRPSLDTPLFKRHSR